jgi:hypothetical protein
MPCCRAARSRLSISKPAPTRLLSRLSNGQHAHMPVYQGEMNNVLGIVNMRRVLGRLRDAEFDPELLPRPAALGRITSPSGTPLLTQLTHFQNNRQSMGLVVDEYGELVGLVTVEDILEEIVGEFTGSMPLAGPGLGAAGWRLSRRRLGESAQSQPKAGSGVAAGRCAHPQRPDSGASRVDAGTRRDDQDMPAMPWRSCRCRSVS